MSTASSPIHSIHIKKLLLLLYINWFRKNFNLWAVNKKYVWFCSLSKRQRRKTHAWKLTQPTIPSVMLCRSRPNHKIVHLCFGSHLGSRPKDSLVRPPNMMQADRKLLKNQPWAPTWHRHWTLELYTYIYIYWTSRARTTAKWRSQHT